MGIHCEISLCKPADGVFTPGSTVSGKIKYSLDEETVFSIITVSLKGHGWLALDDDFQKSNHRNSEDYVDINTVIHNNEKGEPLRVGSYETDFSHKLPSNIPPSFKCIKSASPCTVWCNIKYYIHIKFEKPGMLSFSKNYKKTITVISGATPRLPTKPTVYGERKSLMQLSSLFSSKKSIVNITATMFNSVFKPGDQVKVDYKVENNTNLTLNAVEIKLVQVETFTAKGHNDVRSVAEVKGTDIKYGALQCGETKSFSDEISIPGDLASLYHSKIVSRDYAVSITAVIPLPHRNLVLEIPLQVIDRLDRTFENPSGTDAPPSYWEAMGELKKEELGNKPGDSSDEEKEKS